MTGGTWGGATVQTTATLLMIAIRGAWCSQQVALVPLIMIHQAAESSVSGDEGTCGRAGQDGAEQGRAPKAAWDRISDSIHNTTSEQTYTCGERRHKCGYTRSISLHV